MRKLKRENVMVLGIGFLILLAGGGSRLAIGLVLKPMAEEFDGSRSVIGAAAAIFLIVSSICMFIAGQLVDRFSMRTVLGSGLLFAATGSALMYFVNAPWQIIFFYGLIFAIGNGLASIAPVGVLVSREFPGHLGFANAVTTSGTGIGQVLVIGALAVALASIGWRSSFVWLAVLNLMLAVVVFGLLKGELPRPPDLAGSPADEGSSTLRNAFGRRDLWVLVLIYGICGFQDFFVVTHIVAFAEDKGVATLSAGSLLAFMGLAGVVGVLLSGTWSDHGGPKQVTIACFLVRIATFSLIIYDTSAVSITLFALVYGVTFWMTAPLGVVFARNSFGVAHLGAISGLIVMLHHMCGGGGAYFGAVIFDRDGTYNTAFALMLILSIVGAAACILLPASSRTFLSRDELRA